MTAAVFAQAAFAAAIGARPLVRWIRRDHIWSRSLTDTHREHWWESDVPMALVLAEVREEKAAKARVPARPKVNVSAGMDVTA